MTSKPITKAPAVGQAWNGDWRARVVERLQARGFEGVTAFAESKPRTWLVALAEDLSTDYEVGIDHADVAGDQLARIWREEAKRGGPEAVERMARRLLVGELHRDLPGGWLPDWTESEATRAAASRLTAATTAWACNLDKEQRPATDRVFRAMIDGGRNGFIPAGWLPENADDPILVEIFKRYWITNP